MIVGRSMVDGLVDNDTTLPMPILILILILTMVIPGKNTETRINNETKQICFLKPEVK